MMLNSELLERWSQNWDTQFPVRITRKQKRAFLAMVEGELQARNFRTERVVGRKLVPCENLVTVCAQPRVIFLAHYDTPTVMPFWFSWLFALFGHTRQGLAMVVMLLLLPLPLFLPISPTAVSWINVAVCITLLTLLIPNPHNREDNSSGVVGLMALADWLAAHPALQEHVQLAFLDNEEWGLLGAGVLKKVWQEEGHPYEQASIINLDCVSQGSVPLLVYHGNDGVAKVLRPWLEKQLPALKVMDMGWLALSDNFVFRQQGAVDITYAEPTLIPGGYYIPRVHTPADTCFKGERMLPLLHGLTDFLQANGANNSVV